MDPKEQRSKSPSLLEADAHGTSPAAAPERILSGMEGATSQPAVTHRPRRWLWPSVLLLMGCAAALLLVLGGAFDGTGSIASSRATTHADTKSVAPVPTDTDTSARTLAQHAPDGEAMADTGRNATADASSTATSNSAVILPESPESAVTQATDAPAPAVSASKDAVALSEVFTPASERPHTAPVRPVVRRARSSGDSDVTLLTALIQHVEVGSPASRHKFEKIHAVDSSAAAPESIEARMQACPAANTEAGVSCRQKLCAGHNGDTAACPASASNASGV